MDQIRHIFNIYQIKNRYCDIMLLHVKISFFKTQFMTELLLPLLVVAYCLEISLYVYICPCMYLCLLLMPYAFYICPFMVSTIMTAHSYVWILVNIEQIQFLHTIIFARSTLTFFQGRVQESYHPWDGVCCDNSCGKVFGFTFHSKEIINDKSC